MAKRRAVWYHKDRKAVFWMEEKLKVLQDWLDQSKRVVFFGGAGVSTESNIPDFRSQDGLYNQQYEYPPEVILSHSFFMARTEEFYRFYRSKMIYAEARPNAAHLALARLEKTGKLAAVITQNIDGLHQAAGSKKVLELHGSVLRNRCMSCGKFYAGTEVITGCSGVPRCSCGGVIKPEVTLYEEMLPDGVMEAAVEEIALADMMIVGGTSLGVYPAAGLVNYYRGNRLVLINRSPTPYDSKADLLLGGSIGRILGALQIR